ncbi:MAG: OmpA family protein [Rhodobacteraceae bacterium]|nr:OmpA family protein [Paracoccaceae bacterium]
MVRLNFFISTLIIAGFALASPAVVSAQSTTDMTAEDITNAFKKQKTRGLVIVPSNQPATATTTAAAEPSEESPTTAVTTYAAVERADQVNIQISFDFDSAALREDQKPKLASLCQAMKSVDVAVFQIIGHTDSSGKASYNERLSLLRAQEVKHHLVSSCGIEGTRLQAVGMGESAPFDTSDPRGDVNRRVEFQALG